MLQNGEIICYIERSLCWSIGDSNRIVERDKFWYNVVSRLLRVEFLNFFCKWEFVKWELSVFIIPFVLQIFEAIEPFYKKKHKKSDFIHSRE